MTKPFGNILLEARNLGFTTNHQMILHPVDLQIREKEVYVITGPSGSGKTTLAKLLSHHLNPTCGAVSVADKTQIVYVSQQDRFIASAGLRTTYYGQRYESPNEEGIPTVKEFFKRRLAHLQEEEFAEVTGELEIGYLSDRRLLSLSNGERKRVQLAVALLQKPDLLVLDQPFIGLDVHSREILSNILESQKRKGLSLVIVSDPGFIPSFADFVLEMNNGIVKPTVDAKKIISSEKPVSPVSGNFNTDLLKDLLKEKANYRQVVKM
ncbi:MAG: ATP-binding cassette domain-containing protein [Draconibacterium sp.]